MESSLILDAITKAIATVAINETYKELKNLLKNGITRTTLLSTQKQLEDHLFSETEKTVQWASNDFYENHRGNSDINFRYIHLDLLLEPKKDHINISQLKRKRPLKEIVFSKKGNIVLLGQPGSGKTTSVKHIVNTMLLDSDFSNDSYNLPLVIRLRELNKSNSILGSTQEGGIFEKLSLIFGLNFHIDHLVNLGNKPPIDTTIEDKANLKKLLKTKIIPHILDQQKILLILDGFDEIIDDDIKDLVVSEIRELVRSLKRVNFLLTSRSADYKILLENTNVYEISELTPSQIEEYSSRWFEDPIASENFLKELYEKTPYRDFYTRPLLLTQLALIYSRTGEIPDKPKMIYQRIVEVVLKEWNEAGVKRKTKYSTFTVERKREFLSSMAFNLTIKYNKRVFSNHDLSIIYKEINNKFKELPINEVNSVIEEIETHNGLILRSGYDKYEFSHLTIQEYFVADYIVRTGNINRFQYFDLLKIPNELAIAVSLSSEPAIFLYDLLVDIMLNVDINKEFLDKFFNRIKLEKPDFENDSIQVIALLSAYSKLCIKIERNQKNSFRSSSERSILLELKEKKFDLEQLIIKMFGENIVQTLEGYYVEDNEKYNKTNSSLIEMRKLKAVDDKIGQYNFPKKLYWPR